MLVQYVQNKGIKSKYSWKLFITKVNCQFWCRYKVKNQNKK